MSPRPLGLDRREATGVQEDVPVAERDGLLVGLFRCEVQNVASASEFCAVVGRVDAPGSLNSVSSRPLRRSCSSSLASLNRGQYLAWFSSSLHRCSLACVGKPQLGHSNATCVFSPYLSSETGQ